MERLANALTCGVRDLLPTFFLVVVAWRDWQMLSRGLDYLLGNPAPGTGVFHVTDSTPPIVWGSACVVTSVAVAVGLAFGRVAVLRNAAAVACCIYLAFAVVVFDDVALKYPIDDWRFLTDYVTAAGVWGAIAWLMTIQLAVVRKRKLKAGEETDGD